MNDEMLEQWQRVPQQVAAGIVEGRRLAAAVYEKTAACDGDPQAGEVFWSPATGEAWAVIGNGDPGRWEQALTDSGFTAARVKSSEYPTGDWVRNGQRGRITWRHFSGLAGPFVPAAKP